MSLRVRGTNVQRAHEIILIFYSFFVFNFAAFRDARNTRVRKATYCICILLEL